MAPLCDAHEEFHEFVVEVSKELKSLTATVNRGLGALGLLMALCTVLTVYAAFVR